MPYPFLIRYISGKTLSACFDSETAANQIAAYNQFMARKPHARHIEIKSKTGVWIQHFLEESPQ